MPSRRRRRETTSAAGSTDPVSQFGSMLKAAAAREEAERARVQAARDEATAAARAAEEHARATRAARREVDRAIQAVRQARTTRRGVAEADAAWRRAKARLIELETGEAPEWSPGDEPAPPEAADVDGAPAPAEDDGPDADD